MGKVKLLSGFKTKTVATEEPALHACSFLCVYVFVYVFVVFVDDAAAWWRPGGFRCWICCIRCCRADGGKHRGALPTHKSTQPPAPAVVDLSLYMIRSVAFCCASHYQPAQHAHPPVELIERVLR